MGNKAVTPAAPPAVPAKPAAPVVVAPAAAPKAPVKDIVEPVAPAETSSVITKPLPEPFASEGAGRKSKRMNSDSGKGTGPIGGPAKDLAPIVSDIVAPIEPQPASTPIPASRLPAKTSKRENEVLQPQVSNPPAGFAPISTTPVTKPATPADAFTIQALEKELEDSPLVSRHLSLEYHAWALCACNRQGGPCVRACVQVDENTFPSRNAQPARPTRLAPPKAVGSSSKQLAAEVAPLPSLPNALGPESSPLPPRDGAPSSMVTRFRSNVKSAVQVEDVPSPITTTPVKSSGELGAPIATSSGFPKKIPTPDSSRPPAPVLSKGVLTASTTVTPFTTSVTSSSTVARQPSNQIVSVRVGCGVLTVTASLPCFLINLSVALLPYSLYNLRSPVATLRSL